MRNNALIIFTRVPIEGRTKTRLMPYLTGIQAAKLHAAMLKDIQERARQGRGRCLCISYPRRCPWFVT